MIYNWDPYDWQLSRPFSGQLPQWVNKRGRGCVPTLLQRERLGSNLRPAQQSSISLAENVKLHHCGVQNQSGNTAAVHMFAVGVNYFLDLHTKYVHQTS